MEYLCTAMATSGNLAVPSPLSVRSTAMICHPWKVRRSFSRMQICAVSDIASSQKIGEETENGLKPKENDSSLFPSSFEIQSLLMEICDETSIAELELKMGSFKLRVKRDVTKLKGSSPVVVPLAPPIPSEPMEKSGVSSLALLPPSPKPSSPSTGAITLANPSSKGGSKIGLLEAAADEGLHFVTCPKVGWFRRSRVVKKKSGRPLCEEGQIVKEGQAVCYVEQLGTQHPVEAETSGEVMKILCKDGEPVGYGDPLIAIRPSFAGIN